MNPSDPLYDIMHRTMFNLRYIEDRADKEGPYEVTQLINSFLGALAHPWEKYRPLLTNMSLDEARECGWPEMKKERTEDIDPPNFGELLRLVRNAFAHGNILFIPASTSCEIARIEFWNNRGDERTWGTTLDIADLRRFLDCFVALADEIHTKQNRSKSQSSGPCR
ncbi:MAG: hypothetical protein KIS91_10820 [Anaerolineae bacterium]|nr:hypothetical protein [Anaerolineae bacterium]